MMALSSYHKKYFNELFIFLFLGLQGLINGIFLSTDFFNIYLLIELATITVSILIMYKKDGRSLYDGMMYLIINMVGMAFFLMGVGYIYKIFGALDFQTITSHMHMAPRDQLILPLAFLITGASLKAAFMPLFSWLPKAHGTTSAPSIISAILSGIFVKTGVYLLIRITMIFNTIDLSTFFLVVSFVTAFLGALFATFQKDLKLVLSYSTISQVGIIMLGLTSVTVTGFSGGIFYVLNHGIFKACFFFIVGILMKYYQLKEVHLIKGIWKNSKLISIGIILIILTVTGFPLLGGGIGKYMIGNYYIEPVVKNLFKLLTITTWLYCIPILKMLFGTSDKKIHMTGNQILTLIIMTCSLLVLGVFYQPVIQYLFNYDVSISISQFANKLMEYSVLTFLAFGISYGLSYLKNFKIKVQKFDLRFNTINMAILGYFITITLLLQFQL
jgi:multicomponent Na+:H+ antiporter subunit D